MFVFTIVSGDGDRLGRTAVFVFTRCALTVCVFCLFFRPQARRWLAFTAWRGRTWHRCRLWCSAWARPPSLSSYPSPASWPLCEDKPNGEMKDADARAERTNRAGQQRLKAAHCGLLFVEAEMLWTFGAGRRTERLPVSLYCYCHNHAAVQEQRASPGGDSSSASGPESHASVFHVTSLCQKPSSSGTTRRLRGH